MFFNFEIELYMKKVWGVYFILFITACVFVVSNFNIAGFDFFVFQEQNLFFQSWISIAGILFSLMMALTTYLMYKNTALPSLKYIPLSFLLTSFAFAVIGYHVAYCDVCSNLTLCGASHNYPNFLIVIGQVIFIFIVILFSKRLDFKHSKKVLQIFSYGLICATVLLMITLFLSLDFIESPNLIQYDNIINPQGLFFLFPLFVILYAIVYFKNNYDFSKQFYIIFILFGASMLPQFYHILICKECHYMECSEFYIFSGIIVFIVIGLLLHSVFIQLKEDKIVEN